MPSWVTSAFPRAEKRRTIWIVEGQTLYPRFDRAGAESEAEAEAEASDGAEIETQAQGLHCLWAAGNRRD